MIQKTNESMKELESKIEVLNKEIEKKYPQTVDEPDIKEKRKAGAELCQAQDQLGLFRLQTVFKF